MRFINDDVPIGPQSVFLSTLGRRPIIPDTLAFRQRSSIENVVGHEYFGIELIINVLGRRAGQNIEGVLRLSYAFGSLELFLRSLLVDISKANNRCELIQKSSI